MSTATSVYPLTFQRPVEMWGYYKDMMENLKPIHVGGDKCLVTKIEYKADGSGVMYVTVDVFQAVA